MEGIPFTILLKLCDLDVFTWTLTRLELEHRLSSEIAKLKFLSEPTFLFLHKICRKRMCNEHEQKSRASLHNLKTVVFIQHFDLSQKWLVHKGQEGLLYFGQNQPQGLFWP